MLISLKYLNSMHKDVSNQTVNLLCFYGVQNKKNSKISKFRAAEKQNLRLAC